MGVKLRTNATFDYVNVTCVMIAQKRLDTRDHGKEHYRGTTLDCGANHYFLLRSLISWHNLALSRTIRRNVA
jgi:hypothetical protein